jgi:ABC-type Na+ efflux pump, permease component
MKDTQKQVEQGINIGIRDKGSSQLAGKLKNDKQFIISNVDNLDEELQKGKISAIVEIPDDFDSRVKEEESTNLRIIYDETSSTSEMAMNMIRNYLSGYSQQIVNDRIQGRGIDISVINPFSIESVINKKEQEKANPMGAALLNMLPTFIVLFMFAPTVSVAADLGAGEKRKRNLGASANNLCKKDPLFYGERLQQLPSWPL